MNIWLDKKWKITSDENSYRLEKKINRTETRPQKYFSDLGSLLIEYTEMATRTAGGINGMDDLLKFKKSLVVGLNKALVPLQIRIEMQKSDTRKK